MRGHNHQTVCTGMTLYSPASKLMGTMVAYVNVGEVDPLAWTPPAVNSCGYRSGCRTEFSRDVATMG